jgi:hypothetical protein
LVSLRTSSGPSSIFFASRRQAPAFPAAHRNRWFCVLPRSAAAVLSRLVPSTALGIFIAAPARVSPSALGLPLEFRATGQVSVLRSLLSFSARAKVLRRRVLGFLGSVTFPASTPSCAIFGSVEGRTDIAALSRAPVCAPPLSGDCFPLLFSFPQARVRRYR